MIRLTVIFVAVSCVFGFPSNLTLQDHGERIVGGSKAEPGQFSYLAEIFFTKNGNHQCGGAILTNRWILTAAHCVLGLEASSIKIKVGTTSLDSGGKIYPLNNIIVHSAYDKETKQNDLGLIHTSTPIEFTDIVQPIPLANYDPPTNEDVFIAGWGYTTGLPTTEISNELLFAKVKIVSHTDCALRMIWFNTVTEKQTCTETRGGKGLCGGDSGGPLVHNEKVVGVASWGVPCGKGYPDVYAKVAEYLEWIKVNIE